MKLKAEVVERRYCIEMSVKQFKAVLAGDEKADMVDDELHGLLVKKTPARRVEYDGHFGPFIWFSVTDEDDDKIDGIVDLVEKYIKGKKIT